MTYHPGYWQNETSGVLQPAVEAYLRHAPMTPEQVAAMRAYLRQWIYAAAWDENPHASEIDRRTLAQLRARIDSLTNRVAIAQWLEDADAFGIDPL